jgi:hypothetical protein
MNWMEFFGEMWVEVDDRDECKPSIRERNMLHNEICKFKAVDYNKIFIDFYLYSIKL